MNLDQNQKLALSIFVCILCITLILFVPGLILNHTSWAWYNKVAMIALCEILFAGITWVGFQSLLGNIKTRLIC